MDNLSKLQKLILFTLLTKKGQAMSRSEFREYVYQNYFRTKTPTASDRASLSRSLRHLEERGYLMSIGGRWRLTPTKDFFKPEGEMLVVLKYMEWEEKKRKT
jgi:hypothetical protein